MFDFTYSFSTIMQEPFQNPPTILITGGTSGLGLELVRLYLKEGYEVIATGRTPVHLNEYGGRFSFYKVDFTSLVNTAASVKNICNNHKIDIIINNAGILSPPDMVLSEDKLEYTFQVNFLSHLLLNEIMLRNQPGNQPLKIVAITSMVYRIADSDLLTEISAKTYKPLKTYSDSKLYLAMMCRHLHELYPQPLNLFVGFDPGVFSSEIFRMQAGWFRELYKIAAPFMRSPVKVAGRLAEIIDKKDLVNGSVYDYKKKIRSVPAVGGTANEVFWKECYRLIEPFINI